jgi:hypothetical protein
MDNSPCFLQFQFFGHTGFVGADEGQHLPYLVLGKICEDGAGGGGGAN